MKTRFLKKLRKRFTIEYKDGGQVWIADHKQREVLKYRSISDAVVAIVYEMRGIDSGLDYELRKFERKDRLEFYKFCRDTVYNGSSRHYSGFKYA